MTFTATRKKQKGQMFIIAAIFIVVAIVLISNMVGSFQLSEENRFQETMYMEKQVKNLINEYRNVVGVAAQQQDGNVSGMEYMRNMSLMARDDFDAAIVYVFIYANGTNQKYSVTIGNFLQDRMNVTFNATNTNPGGRLITIDDKVNETREYEGTANGTVEINITYTSENVETIERFNITTSTSDQAFGFFDVTVRDSGFFVRQKEIYNWTWPV